MSAPRIGWSLEAYIAHNEALHAAEARFQEERDRRYREVAEAHDSALHGAVEKLEVQLTPLLAYVAQQQGGSKGMRDVWNWIFAGIAGISTLITIAAVFVSVMLYLTKGS